MSQQEITKGIEAMQRVQQTNPPTSEKWQRASEVLRRLISLQNGVTITLEMWANGITR